MWQTAGNCSAAIDSNKMLLLLWHMSSPFWASVADSLAIRRCTKQKQKWRRLTSGPPRGPHWGGHCRPGRRRGASFRPRREENRRQRGPLPSCRANQARATGGPRKTITRWGTNQHEKHATSTTGTDWRRQRQGRRRRDRVHGANEQQQLRTSILYSD